MTEFAVLSYIADNNDENIKAKDIVKSVIKRKLKFEDYKNFLKANQLLKEINNLESNKLEVNSLRKSHKEFSKSIRLFKKNCKNLKARKCLHNSFSYIF